MFGPEQGVSFCKEFEQLTGRPAWIIGTVERGEPVVTIAENPELAEVPGRNTVGSLW